ncbi:MAG: acetamidase/formamidase family protein [Bacillota bacterium]|nr:acetamidase/formamidase family protein [Bacillota bacterium]
MATQVTPARWTVYVEEFTDGILDPGKPMLGPVKDGGRIVAYTAPGCWGPMLTPSLKGGHEVTVPVAVEGTRPGDAVAIVIESIQVTSLATASGNDRVMEGRFIGDPYVAARCPQCGTLYPPTRIEGIGPGAIRCAHCGADVVPFTFRHGYTMVFDHQRGVGLTVAGSNVEEIARNGREWMKIPEASQQNAVVTLMPQDLKGAVARMRPFLGQLGTTPSHPFPDSHNAGDFGASLVDAPHDYRLTAEELKEHRTDGHMDINRVREGAILLAPVKVEGAGIYLGDLHAMQGDGEIAGHTTDVSGIITLRVHRLPGASIPGPILLPRVEDLPYLARPLSPEEKEAARMLAAQWGQEEPEEDFPISFVGTGPNLNDATENGLERAAQVLGITVPEVLNRATITGSIEIGRHPGVVTVTFRAPRSLLEKAGLLPWVEAQYGTA